MLTSICPSPIKNWSLIPATLSSQFEGGLMEAIRRLCPGISTRDFWARMPNAGDKRVRAVGITALANRQERFRFNNGLVSWVNRGFDPVKDAVKAKLSPSELADNSTRRFLGLTKAELRAAQATRPKRGHEKTENENPERESRHHQTADLETCRDSMGSSGSSHQVYETESTEDDF